MARRFTRRRGGTVDATFERGELQLLEGLPEQLRALYGGTDDDPARARLFPRAYLDPTEEQAESEWEELVHPGLLEARLDALGILETTIAAAEPTKRDRVVVHLSTEQANAWLNVLNDARLALGSRLGVTDDTDLATLDPSDPNAPTLAAYGWFTYLEGELVDTLLGDMPD
jgi:Domain of unknown function (DUF2017)